jgi:hypothetical protein
MVARRATGYARTALLSDPRQRPKPAMRLRDFGLALAIVLMLSLVPLGHAVNAWRRTPRLGQYFKRAA